MILEKDKYNLRAHVDYYANFNGENFPRLELFDETIKNFHMVNTEIDKLNSIHGKFHSIYFINVTIGNGEFRLTDFENCFFKDVTFNKSIFAKVQFTNCIFENCVFESIANIDQDEFIKFESCFMNGVDLSKARIHPAFQDVITNSTCANLTIVQSAIDTTKNTILQRKSQVEAPAAKAPAPKTPVAKPAAKEATPAAPPTEITKVGDTEKPADPGTFSDRFGGIEFKKKESKES